MFLFNKAVYKEVNRPHLWPTVKMTAELGNMPFLIWFDYMPVRLQLDLQLQFHLQWNVPVIILYPDQTEQLEPYRDKKSHY